MRVPFNEQVIERLADQKIMIVQVNATHVYFEFEADVNTHMAAAAIFDELWKSKYKEPLLLKW